MWWLWLYLLFEDWLGETHYECARQVPQPLSILWEKIFWPATTYSGGSRGGKGDKNFVLGLKLQKIATKCFFALLAIFSFEVIFSGGMPSLQGSVHQPLSAHKQGALLHNNNVQDVFVGCRYNPHSTQVHLKTKNVICEQCGSTFYHASNLKRHREAVHLVK